MRILICIFLSTLLCCRGAPNNPYEGFKVFRLLPQTANQTGFLENLAEEESALDFWAEPNSLGIPVDVMVPPYKQQDFMEMMNSHGMKPNVFIDDIQSKINAEKVQSLSRSGFNWKNYYNLQDIYTWLDSQEYMYPDKVTIINAGESYQERVIKGVKISFGEGRRVVFIEGGIHSREWISPATVTYLINELLTSEDPTFRKIAESFDWYIVPVSNPDGYIFTHQGGRFWRKTRSLNLEHYSLCRGTDANRNWKYKWGVEGASNQPCSETYKGRTAFSEAETKSLSEYIDTLGEKMDVYLSFHSYSQLMLLPYGHTKKHLDNYDDMMIIGLAAAKALSQRYGTEYKVGNVAETIYKASGSSVDWVKNKYKVPIAMTYELRDKGEHGFILPADQIIPNCEEVMDSLVALFLKAEELKYFKLGAANNVAKG